MGNSLTIQNVRDSIVGIDVQVPLLDGSYRSFINLDNASSTPALSSVVGAVRGFLAYYASVGRGTGYKSMYSSYALNEARRLVAEFVGGNPDEHAVIFGKNTTEAINKLAHRYPFGRGDIVLTTMMEHHSNDLPWRRVAEIRYVTVDSKGVLDMDHLKYLLEKLAPRVRLVTVSGASNVTGYINPIHEIAALAHRAGARVLVDAAQLAPHRAIEMRPGDDPSHIDYLAYTAHKMYAPFGIGALVGTKDAFLSGDPDCVGGGTVDLVTIDDAHWAELPGREEAGTPNVIGAVAWGQAIRILSEIGMEEVATHEAELTAYLLEGLGAMKEIVVYGSRDASMAEERLGVVPIAVEGVPHKLVAAVLGYEGGIGVRSGLFCAHPYMLELLQVSRSDCAAFLREADRGFTTGLPGLTRISFGLYNNKVEIDHLLELLSVIRLKAHRGNYIRDQATGDYVPQGFSYEGRYPLLFG